MIAPRRVVIVLQAEKLFDPKKKRKAADSVSDDDEAVGSLEPLIDYLASPSPTTALAFVFSSPDGGKSPADIPLARNLKVTKALAKAATIVVARSRRRERSGALDRAAGDRCGTLGGTHGDRPDPAGEWWRHREASSDVEKLLLFATGAGRLTLEHVAAVAGAPEHRSDDWALVNAVQRGDVVAALRELTAELDEGDNGAPFRILGQLGAAVRNPNARTPFPTRRVPAAVDVLLRTDLALKSSGGDPRVLLERLVVELCG